MVKLDEKLVIFEDEDLLVINKPAGITVNNSQTTIEEVTVQDLVVDYLRIKNVGIKGEESEDEENTSDFASRSGIVHRIDKETSGILLVAKNELSFTNLQAQFKAREVHKTYQALAHGRISPSEGEINAPVGRLPWNRRQFGVVAGGRVSVTFYKVMDFYRTDNKKRDIVTMVRLKPITGRTHQIRVHLQYLGHPIFSDFLYAGRKVQREDRKLLSRVFLHAKEISFFHPRSGQRLELASPLPSELEALLDHLVPIV